MQNNPRYGIETTTEAAFNDQRLDSQWRTEEGAA